MSECSCRIEDGHLVPCPEAKKLKGDIETATFDLTIWAREVSPAARARNPDEGDRLLAVREHAFRAYEDHVIAAAMDHAFDTQLSRMVEKGAVRFT